MRKNKTFFHSVKYASKGIIKAFKEERNFKIYLGLLLSFGILNWFIGISTLYWLIYLLASLVSFSLECVNTAIERICNFINTEYNSEIGAIKDIAAGGVLYTGIAYFLIEGIIVWKHL